MADTRGTVLVVDDQADERRIQGAMLAHLGFAVREAGDGISAVAAAVGDPPDLVLLDVSMPRMDGFEVCRALRADPRTADIPVLFLTASTAMDVAARATEAGAQGCLTKPIDPREVAETVARLVVLPGT
ncbi:MAG TPA: response regulator [Longimicrobiaceae bacterium]